jgi:hypothetical protein
MASEMEQPVTPEEQMSFISAYLERNGFADRVAVVLDKTTEKAVADEGDVPEAGEDSEWVDDASSDSDADDAGPKKAPLTGRSMVAQQDFAPGEIIFTEAPLLHTNPRPPIKGNPFPSVDIPFDWQRLLHHYVYVTTLPTDENAPILGALAVLSTDGVTSSRARKADPERIPYWRSGAKGWVEKLKAKAKKTKSKKPPGVNTETIERLLWKIETNCHSRDRPEMDLDISLDEEDIDLESLEEEVGIYFAGSMINHSCLPNASVTVHASDGPETEDCKPTWLTLRCIAPIAKGGAITISYTDESFMPAMHRAARLMIRGFKCQCELCQWDDVFRGAQCSCRKDGAPFAMPPSWMCAACGQKLVDKSVSKVEKMESDYLNIQDEVQTGWLDLKLLPSMLTGASINHNQEHDARYVKVVESLSKKVLAWVRKHEGKHAEVVAISCVSAMDSPHPPLHASHWLVTSYARDLVESGSVELSPDETVAARLFLVSADLFSMSTWTQAHPNRPWEFSEDLHHDLDALVAAVESREKVENSEGPWTAIGAWAREKRDKQVAVLGSD